MFVIPLSISLDTYSCYIRFYHTNNPKFGYIIVFYHSIVLKHANSVLKGYATSISVVLTGILSNLLFGTSLSILYGMGIINVIIAVFLYNADSLHDYSC